MVKYGLIPVIIGLIQLGWATFEPPPFPPHVYSTAENITLRVFFFFFLGGGAAAATMALLGSDRSEGVKVNAGAALRSGRTCRATQAVFFLHKREGDGSVS